MKYLLILVLALTACAQHKDDPDDTPATINRSCFPKIASSRVKTVDTSLGTTFFETGVPSELVTCLPSFWPLRNAKYEHYPIYRIRLLNIKAGDILVVDVEFECTNNMGVAMQIASQLQLLADGVFIPLDQPNGFNITPESHHGVTVKHAVYQFTTDVKEALITTDADTATKGFPRAFLIVEPRYGQMQGYVLRQ